MGRGFSCQRHRTVGLDFWRKRLEGVGSTLFYKAIESDDGAAGPVKFQLLVTASTISIHISRADRRLWENGLCCCEDKDRWRAPRLLWQCHAFFYFSCHFMYTSNTP